MAVPLRSAVLSRPSRGPVLAAAVVWLLVGVSAAGWFWRVWGRSVVVPVPVAVAQRPQVDADTVARALGAGAASTPTEAVATSRLALLGVVRDVQGRGAALIAENGATAKPYRVGDRVPGGWVLRSLEPRQARLDATDGSGPAMRLVLPAAAGAGTAGSAPTAPMAPVPAAAQP